MRYLILVHRYLGIGIGVLMVVWCLTGVVMMYVRYPALLPAERVRHLEPLDWRRCCVVSESSLPDTATVTEFQVESIASRPVLRAKLTPGGWRLVDLTDGQLMPGLTQQEAAEVAASFSRATAPVHISAPAAYVSASADVSPPTARPRLQGVIDYDQWTVSGEFNPARPLFLFALDDMAGTQLYVSRTTGKLVQVTSARERFWNWVGAVPHWLYFSVLRRNVRVWGEVVIWTSLAGTFLALLGIYIGLKRLLWRRPGGRWSPYRGFLFWHHVPGLLFGVFVLTWVGSGLVSMNPWGFLDSGDGRHRAVEAFVGAATPGAQLRQALSALASAPLPQGVVSVQSAPLFGQLYLVATAGDGTRVRVDARGSPAPLGNAEWASISAALRDGIEAGAVAEPIADGDAYYYSHRGHSAPFPVYRIVVGDEQNTRYYLDPVSGVPLESVDSNERWYRWLHQGLHTLDFFPSLRARPGWDLLMLCLLSGVTVVCVTGAYLGLRRVI